MFSTCSIHFFLQTFLRPLCFGGQFLRLNVLLPVHQQAVPENPPGVFDPQPGETLHLKLPPGALSGRGPRNQGTGKRVCCDLFWATNNGARVKHLGGNPTHVLNDLDIFRPFSGPSSDFYWNTLQMMFLWRWWPSHFRWLQWWEIPAMKTVSILVR